MTLSSGALAFPIGLGKQGALPLLAKFDVIEAYPGPLFLRAVPRGSHLLGQVFSTRIGGAAEGDTLELDLALQGHELARATVDRHELVWKWQHSEDERKWTDFDETAHTVFTLLDHPAPPWGGPADPCTVVPWLETMNTACGWAKGVRNPQAAMDRVTTNVDALGGKKIGDDTLDYGGGVSVTWQNIFFISDFMEAVNGEPGAPGAMNCVDLASAVGVFAAQIGCRSRALRLRPETDDSSDQLRTNRVRLFGEPCACIESFFFHEVAQLGEQRAVWDACVSVDFDDHPETNPPGELGLPKGMSLDGDQEPWGIGYPARLLRPHQSFQLLNPGGDGIRYPNAVPPGVREKRDPFERARRRLFFAEMLGLPWSQPTAATLDGGFQAWLESVTLDRAFRRPVSSGSRILRFIPIRLQDGQEKSGAEVSVLRPPTRRHSVDIFLGLLTSYAHSLRRASSLGDFAMYGERDDIIFLLRGGLIAVIQGGRRPGAESALSAARALDGRLANYFAA